MRRLRRFRLYVGYGAFRSYVVSAFRRTGKVG